MTMTTGDATGTGETSPTTTTFTSTRAITWPVVQAAVIPRLGFVPERRVATQERPRMAQVDTTRTILLPDATIRQMRDRSPIDRTFPRRSNSPPALGRGRAKGGAGVDPEDPIWEIEGVQIWGIEENPTWGTGGDPIWETGEDPIWGTSPTRLCGTIRCEAMAKIAEAAWAELVAEGATTGSAVTDRAGRPGVLVIADGPALAGEGAGVLVGAAEAVVVEEDAEVVGVEAAVGVAARRPTGRIINVDPRMLEGSGISKG